MKANVVALTAFLTIFVLLSPAIGGLLKCQRGNAFSLEGTDRSRIKNCTFPTEQYCVEVTCTALDQPGNINKYWDCVVSQEAGHRIYEQAMAEQTKSKNVSCEYIYGKKGENATNVASSAAENRLRCKAGTEDALKTGRTYYNDCLDGYKYCYAADCAKAKCYAGIVTGNEHVQTMWGCSKDTHSCEALSVAVSAQLDAAVKCECTFGAYGVQYGNNPISTTTPQKPSTSTITTSTTKTTTTEKPTTTKTTTTEKPTTTKTTLKGPMSTTGQPMTTIAEENCSARCSFAIFWILLVAIGTMA